MQAVHWMSHYGFVYSGDVALTLFIASELS